MTEKRFTFDEDVNEDDMYEIGVFFDNGKVMETIDVLNCLNNFHEENEELKQELKIYRNIANCSNCKYQNYDWFEDGDEFEICERGNTEQQIEYHICKDWREL